MKDQQFWDTFLSSLEDLMEEPPSTVKEGVFQGMDRYYRRRRRLKRGGLGLLLACVLGGGTFLFTELDDDTRKKLAGDQVEIPEYAKPLGPAAHPPPQAGKQGGGTSSHLNEPKKGMLKRSSAGGGEKEDGVKKYAQTESEKGNEQKEEAKGVASREVSEAGSSDNSPESLHEEGGRTKENEAYEGDGTASASSGSRMERKEVKMKESEAVSSAKNAEKNLAKEGLDPMQTRLPKVSSVSPEELEELGFQPPAEAERSSLATPRFFVGSDLAFNFTRVMDSRTKKSFEQRSLVSTDGELYFDLGLTVGYDLSDRTRLIGRYFMKKDLGQRYYDYIDGRYRAQGIQLSYRSYGLLIEHDLANTSLTHNADGILSAYGGGRLGTLRQAQVTEEGRDVDVSEYYKDQVFSVEGGLRVSMRTRKGLDVGVLFGASCGLTQARSSSSGPSVATNSSRTLSSGAALSLRYNFGR